MGFAVTLDLGNFGNRLMCGAAPGIFGGDRTAAWLSHHPHQAVGKVPVMRDRQHLAAGVLFISLHLGPEIVGPLAGFRIPGSNGGNLVRTVAENHVAMQVIAGLHQGVFKAHEGRELARLVIAFDSCQMRVPQLAGTIGIGFLVVHEGGNLARSSRCQHFTCRLQRAFRPFVHHVVPAQRGGIGEHHTRRFVERLGCTDPFGVVADHEEIERPGQFGFRSGGRFHLLALGKAQCGLGIKPGAEPKGIDRVAGVKVRIAPEHLFGIGGVLDLCFAAGPLAQLVAAGD